MITGVGAGRGPTITCVADPVMNKRPVLESHSADLPAKWVNGDTGYQPRPNFPFVSGKYPVSGKRPDVEGRAALTVLRHGTFLSLNTGLTRPTTAAGIASHDDGEQERSTTAIPID